MPTPHDGALLAGVAGCGRVGALTGSAGSGSSAGAVVGAGVSSTARAWIDATDRQPSTAAAITATPVRMRAGGIRRTGRTWTLADV